MLDRLGRAVYKGIDSPHLGEELAKWLPKAD